MKYLLLGLLLNPAFASEPSLELPKNDDQITWDHSAISIFYEGRGRQQKTFLTLKGTLTHANPKSFTLQVDSEEAMKVNLKGKGFEEKIRIPKVPAKVRLWLEHKDGKAVLIDRYEVQVRVKPSDTQSKDHLINY